MTQFMTVEQISAHLVQLCRNERKLTHEILTHVNLFEQCAGHTKLGYSSMQQYLTRHLGYSDDQAFRRLKAARLMRQIPEVAEKFQQGTLNLSQAAQAQTAFEQAHKENKCAVSVETKKTLLSAIENANNFDTKKILATNLDLQLKTEEIVKPQARQTVRLETTLSATQFEKLQQIKSLLSHKIPDQNTGAVLEAVFDFFLEKKKLAAFPENENENENENGTWTGAKGGPSILHYGNVVLKTGSTSEPSLETKKRVVKNGQAKTRYIPLSTKQQLWKRAKSCCEHVGPQGNRCRSRFQLEVDHRIPFSRGGSNDLENLVLLCNSHNLAKATQQAIGPETLQTFRGQTY